MTRNRRYQLLTEFGAPSTTDGIRSSVCPYLFERGEKGAMANASIASQTVEYIPFRVGC